MKHIISHRTFALIRWVGIWAAICVQLSQFTFPAAAQEPTSEPTSLPTPTPAPTWTPAPAPTSTPDPAVTPTANPTASGRVVDFRVDDNEIEPGACVMFSWVVRGDIDRVEFDTFEDNKSPVLVSDMDSRQECPSQKTDYGLNVIWLDGTRISRTIEVDLKTSSGGDNSTSAGTATPAGTAVFVAVTPIPVAISPGNVASGPSQSPASLSASGGMVVTPIGVLASVQVLPETGYRRPTAPDTLEPANNPAADQSQAGGRLAFAGGLLLVLGTVVVGSALAAKVILKNGARR